MKKGFTLIEMIGAIILLGTLSLLIIPIVNKNIKQSKEKLYIAQIEEIKLATEKWAYKNMDMLPNDEGKVVEVTLLELKKSGDLPLDIRDPRTNTLISNQTTVQIIYTNNMYEYIVNDYSDSNDVNIDKYAPTIVLNGNSVEYVTLNSQYTEKGVVAKDYENNIINDVTIQYQKNNVEVSKINTSLVGTYTVYYTAKNIHNGITHTRTITRTVIITN
ncbi:MAG: DUF5011 domain-containing protein [Candidatus Faecisoma sp.]|nr:DUF5011 domain-containing protein [Acholeplasma sp.]MCI5677482.1 DUF5011 domain-containing protein [Acholeplasma sp.]MDY2892649.1 DUF5011 domain-containing protein [Candidatus Faecisoma sp.]